MSNIVDRIIDDLSIQNKTKQKRDEIIDLLHKIYQILAINKNIVNADNIEQKLENLYLKFQVDYMNEKQPFVDLIYNMQHQTFIQLSQENKREYHNLLCKMKSYLSPEGPSFDNLYSWLWSNQLNEVLLGFEQNRSDFKYMGIQMLDFNIHYQLRKQFLDIQKYNVPKFGYIINLCKYKDDGTHWLSLFIDFQNNSVFYFDSTGFPPMQKIIKIQPLDQEKIKKDNDTSINNGIILQQGVRAILRHNGLNITKDISKNSLEQNIELMNDLGVTFTKENNPIWPLLYYICKYGRNFINHKDKIFDFPCKDKYFQKIQAYLKEKDGFLQYKGNAMQLFINATTVQKKDGQCGMFSIYSLMFLSHAKNKQEQIVVNHEEIANDEQMAELRYKFYRGISENQKRRIGKKSKQKYTGIYIKNDHMMN